MKPATNELLRQAEAHASRRDWPQARSALQSALAADPANAAVHLQLSYVESLSGHYRAAREQALAAHAAKPRDAETLRELMARLRTFNEAQALHELLARLGSPSQLPIPLLIVAAAQLSYLNEQDAALRYLDEAVRADPRYPPTLLARGQVLTYLGRFDDAAKDLEACIARAPEIAQAHWFLSRLEKQKPNANHVDRLRRMLSTGGQRRPDDIALLAFALHKELDDLGEHVGAWNALVHACQAKRATLDYQPAQTHALIDALIAMPVQAPVAPIDNARTPIFIVGMHRSGTTLLEQLLDGHSQVHGVGELYDFTSQMRHATDHHCRGVIDTTIVQRAAQADFAAAGAGYLAGMEWRLHGERCFTDKLPSNFLNIGFICRALPQAKILHMVRDPVETCFSNLRELFSDANPYSYDPLELADYYRQYERLMAHWRAAYPDRILDVDYAELTRDTENVLRRVAAFCELDFEPRMLELGARERGVATASAVQVREGVVAREVPKWAPYAEPLKPMIEALQR
ncbi:MAG: tetratricopeptide repeat protein [Lysobacter sp.]|nr:tetratricopeptide repeat protein [Lysobacter sp.]